jgi:fatty acyl-CoA reductase
MTTANKQDSLKVKEFYTDKTILISGCTGFLGKIILEKIIRTCPDVRKIYVLIRKKQGMSLNDRL